MKRLLFILTSLIVASSFLFVGIVSAKSRQDTESELNFVIENLEANAPVSHVGKQLGVFFIHGFEPGTSYGCNNEPNVTYWDGGNGGYSALTVYQQHPQQVAIQVAAWCSHNRIEEGSYSEKQRVSDQFHTFNQSLNPHHYNGSTGYTVPIIVVTHSTGALYASKIDFSTNVAHIANQAGAGGGTEGAYAMWWILWHQNVLADLDRATDSYYGHQTNSDVSGRVIPTHYSGSVYGFGDGANLMDDIVDSGAGMFIKKPHDGVLPAHSTGGAQNQYGVPSNMLSNDYRKESQTFVYNYTYKYEYCKYIWWGCSIKSGYDNHGRIPGATVAFFNNKAGTDQGYGLGTQSTDMDHYKIHKVGDGLFQAVYSMGQTLQANGLY